MGPSYKVLKAPRLTILGPEVYSLKEGEELALICRDENLQGTEHLVWKKKSGSMPNGQDYIGGGQVILEKVGREDSGEYQCVDTSAEEKFFKDILVNVLCK